MPVAMDLVDKRGPTNKYKSQSQPFLYFHLQGINAEFV